MRLTPTHKSECANYKPTKEALLKTRRHQHGQLVDGTPGRTSRNMQRLSEQKTYRLKY